MSFKIYMMRYMIGRSDRKRDKGLQYPEDVTRYENISYGPTKMQVLDVYRPSKIEGKLPVIVSVHGGGWVYGNKKIYRHYCLSLARRGFVVVNFTYRLSPEYKYPAQLEDTAKVFRWVCENAENYGMDSENIFAVGDSAGAHILSTYCALCINPEYAATYSFATEYSSFPLPKAVGLNCGVYDMSLIQEGSDGSTKSLMKDVLPKGGTEEELRWVSPILHIREGFPPSYIMTASGDFVKGHAQPLFDKLQELGVPCTLKVYDDGTNHLGHVFHCDMRNETGRICNDEECEFFRSYLNKQKMQNKSDSEKIDAIHQRFEFRDILPEEADQAVIIEQICFPPHEACPVEKMKERVAMVPELFLVAVDKETGKIAGFLNGLATNEAEFRDEFFTDSGLYNPTGSYVMLCGLDVLPEYRGQGLATEIMQQYIQRELQRGRKQLILTCLEEKLPMYEKMGYRNNGIANSTWGGEEWYEMIYELPL